MLDATMEGIEIPYIVFTLISTENKNALSEISKHLPFRIQEKVNYKTTHVIVDKENIRTIKLIMGIVRGCWIVNFEWIRKSVEANKWISEEDFEITSFSPGVRLNRYDRQNNDKDIICDLFDGFGSFYVSAKSRPPSVDLKEIIRLCSGKLVRNANNADYVIGQLPSSIKATNKMRPIKEKWVFDCITKFRILNVKDYLLD